jgi:phosphatidylglycerophosphate synthase
MNHLYGDKWAGRFLLALLFVLVVAYTIRLLTIGQAHFERVDKQGGSRFLGKSFMQMGYWGLQPLAGFCIRFKFTPNQLTWFSLVLGIGAGAGLALGAFGWASLFATGAMLLDALDGLVARETGVASEAGEVLDAAIDRYVEFFFLAGLVLYYRFFWPAQSLVLLTLLGSFMVSYSTAKAEAMRVDLPAKGMRRPERVLYLVLGALLSIFFESPLAVPMLVALALVAIFSNWTAARRFYFIAESVKS